MITGGEPNKAKPCILGSSGFSDERSSVSENRSEDKGNARMSERFEHKENPRQRISVRVELGLRTDLADSSQAALG